MDDILRYIGKTEQFGRLDKTDEIHAIQRVLNPLGLTIDELVNGVRVDQYRIPLNPDTNVNKVMKLRDNICIAVNSDNVTMAIHGNMLTIDVPGYTDGDLSLGDIYDSFKASNASLPLMMGRSVSGEDIIIDLAKQPHMLIGGTTGSGKSILEHACIASILLHDPNIEIYAVDMKRTEFNVYSELPNFHYVNTEAQAIMMLHDVVRIMEQRYENFGNRGYRDIAAAQADGCDIKPIVVVIDELADLMIKAGSLVEPEIIKLAQKSRAAGIHLILSTQSPRHDVVTGLIKANIPCKVCLKVVSNMESRIVLDRVGGEKLLGYGDMLLLTNGSFNPIRVQGCYLTDTIMNNIVELSKGESSPQKSTKSDIQEHRSFFKQTSFYQVFSAIKRMAVGM